MLNLPHKLLLSSMLVLSAFQVNYSAAIEISSYARVSKNGADSISTQSDRGNKSIDQTSTKVSDIDSTLIDEGGKNETAFEPADEHEVKRADDKSSSEKSTGRAVQSNYYFPLKELLTRPVSRNNNNNQKTGRFIVYPSYAGISANSIDKTRTRVYNMMPPTGQQQQQQQQQLAQRRFQYTPDTLYKPKGSESNQGYQYAEPPAPAPIMKFTAPIVVPDAPPPRPAYLPPDMLPSSPPKSSYIQASPPKPTYLPPNMMPTASGSQPFLPTIPPEESSSTNPVIDLLAFPSHVNSSFMPTELDAIKHSIESNHQPNVDIEPPTEDETTDTPASDLDNFPPNIVYASPDAMKKEKKIDIYLPPASGGDTDDAPPPELAYIPPKDLSNFPPNIASSYLPPEMMMKSKSPISSYLPPASGNSDSPPPATDEEPAYTPPKNLHNFPPNIDSAYLPPSMLRNKVPIDSYLPPPSGDNDDYEEPPANHQMYLPPKDLNNFPPNIQSSYLPPGMKLPQVSGSSYIPPASGSETDNPYPYPSYMYMVPQPAPVTMNIPPAPIPYTYNPPSNMFIPPKSLPPNIPPAYLPPEMKQQMATVHSYLPPSSGSVSGFSEASNQNIPGPMAPEMPPPAEMMPSGPPMDMPPMDHDHHDHHHDHTAPDYPKWFSSHDDHQDIIYDYDHHHHHHHEEPPPPETTTVEAPEEPRVKKYSYYYLGRKLWYIPLYFTLWFCLYVAALIIRSIGRHKVDLPNHYVSRSLHDMSHKETLEKINTMTAFTMQQIEDFKEKYL